MLKDIGALIAAAGAVIEFVLLWEHIAPAAALATLGALMIVWGLLTTSSRI